MQIIDSIIAQLKLDGALVMPHLELRRRMHNILRLDAAHSFGALVDLWRDKSRRNNCICNRH